MSPPDRVEGEVHAALHAGPAVNAAARASVDASLDARPRLQPRGTGAGPLSRGLAALVAGLVFGLGLSMAQMVDPRKVLAFLDLAGAWDASLLFVLGAAVMVSGAGFALLRRRQAPLLDSAFHPPAASALDAPLVAGSALFGIGWGLAGYCPGPAIASLGFGNAEALWFLPAMLAGMALRRRAG